MAEEEEPTYVSLSSWPVRAEVVLIPPDMRTFNSILDNVPKIATTTIYFTGTLSNPLHSDISFATQVDSEGPTPISLNYVVALRF